MGGEMGYVRVAFGALQVESQCSWGVVQSYTAAELNNQIHCHEGVDNCGGSSPSPSPSPAPPAPTPPSYYSSSDALTGKLWLSGRFSENLISDVSLQKLSNRK